MSVDFQVAFPREAVHLSNIRILPGVVPRSLEIIGEDFRSVDEVTINQIPSPDVIILSKTRLIAQLPDQLRTDRLVSVSVINRRLRITDKSFMEFRVSRTPSKVKGILRLMQLFLKILFTTQGTDIFSPRIGAGGLKNIGQTFGADEGESILNDFIISVDTASRQIVAFQARDPRIPRDERLLATKVVSAGYSRQESALLVGVELTSQAGRAATANLEL